MLFIYKISKILAPFLTLMVFISSMSCTIDFHYCQGQLKSYSLLGKAKNCHEISEKIASCPHHQNENSDSLACTEDDKNCCSNETIHIESDIDKPLINLDFLTIDSHYFVVAFKASTFTDLLGEVEDNIPHAHYKPPLIQKDISVLFESFLL